MYKKEANSGAKKICGIGRCICSYDCGHSNRENIGLKLLGKNQVCPLLKYNVKPDKRKCYEIHYNESTPTETEFFALCANCEHGSVKEYEDHYEAVPISFEDFCIDCPVYSTRESMLEAAAEARMS